MYKVSLKTGNEIFDERRLYSTSIILTRRLGANKPTPGKSETLEA